MHSHAAGSQISNYAYLISVINSERFDHTGSCGETANLKAPTNICIETKKENL